MKLYIVRHGRALSATGAFNGLDLPELEEESRDFLSEIGLKQAELLGWRLKDVKFDIAYTSHLPRAVQTAANILKYQKKQLTLEIFPELSESGTSADFTVDEEMIKSVYPKVIFHGRDIKKYGSVEERAGFCVDNLIKKNAYGYDLELSKDSQGDEVESRNVNVLIVAHAVMNAHLISSIVNFPFNRRMVVSQDNTCVNTFEFYTVNGEQRMRFLGFNNTDHLK